VRSNQNMEQLSLSSHGGYDNASLARLGLPGFVSTGRTNDEIAEYIVELVNSGSFYSYHPFYKHIIGSTISGNPGHVCEMRFKGNLPAFVAAGAGGQTGATDTVLIIVDLSPFGGCHCAAGVGGTENKFYTSAFTPPPGSGVPSNSQLEDGTIIHNAMLKISNSASNDGCVGVVTTGADCPIRGSSFQLVNGVYNGEFTPNNAQSYLEAGAVPAATGPLNGAAVYTIVTPNYLEIRHEAAQHKVPVSTNGSNAIIYNTSDLALTSDPPTAKISSSAYGSDYARPFIGFLAQGLNEESYNGLSVEVIYYGSKSLSLGSSGYVGYTNSSIPREEVAKVTYKPFHRFGR